jgi:hypothetical protein
MVDGVDLSKLLASSTRAAPTAGRAGSVVLVLEVTSQFGTKVKCEVAALLEDVVVSWGWGSPRVEGAPVRVGVWCNETTSGIRDTEVSGAAVGEWVVYRVAVGGRAGEGEGEGRIAEF